MSPTRLMILLKPALSFVLLSACGCATIVNGTHQTVRIETDPPGASVSTGLIQLVTPAEIRLSRTHTHCLLISKQGYESRQIFLHREMSSLIYVNCLFLFIPGAIIDFYSGGGYKLKPDQCLITLDPSCR